MSEIYIKPFAKRKLLFCIEYLLMSGAAMDIHNFIGKLPRPKKGFVWPGHKYTGPYNPLHEQLNENDLPIIGQEPVNPIDEISMRHDICYRDHPHEKKRCDNVMLEELGNIKPKNWRESIDKRAIGTIMSTKSKLGLGIKWTDSLAEELHKPIRKKFKKRFVFVKKANDIWAADLIDLRSHANVNGGMKYILMVIDCFSKYGYAVPIKYKTGAEVTEAFESLFEKETPKFLWVDRGSEFYNSDLKGLLKKYDIKMYSTHNAEKVSVVERWNRTIKTKLWKYFSANGTYKYIDILQPLIDKYNRTKHRSTGYTPIEAKKAVNHDKVFKNLFQKKAISRSTLPKFKVGDQVRIILKKKIFDKGYTSNWTNKLYSVAEVLKTLPVTYKIKDDSGILAKTYYEPELQKSDQEVFHVEKILRWKVINGKKFGRVKWVGYDSSYNSWEPEENIKHVKDV